MSIFFSKGQSLAVVAVPLILHRKITRFGVGSLREVQAIFAKLALTLTLALFSSHIEAQLGTSISQLAAGGSHTCVAETAGSVKCWGENGNGQLGMGSSVSKSSVPQTVVGLGGVTQVAAGWNHTCALETGGRVMCWGANSAGQLGLGNFTSFNIPQPVPGLNGVTQLVSGAAHTCAIVSTGEVSCWGLNFNGQLGVGTNINASTPQSIAGFNNVTQLSAGGFHSCARDTAGTVKCWGGGESGQLGVGISLDFWTPQLIPSLSEVMEIAAGAYHTCARDVAGTVRCWGEGNGGQLGDGIFAYANTPKPVMSIKDVVKITAGWEHSCGLTSAGSLFCWGGNTVGQIGVGNSNEFFATPQAVLGLGSLRQVVAGGLHTCVVETLGALKCWGNDSSGQLGLSTNVVSGTPQIVPTKGVAIRRVAAGDSHTCIIEAGGAVKCWGAGNRGQLGIGGFKNATAPQLVKDVSATQLVAGGAHTCGLEPAGTVTCWGYGAAGQLGQDGLSNSDTPKPVASLINIKQIAVGFDHSCALDAGGVVKCWGANSSGQLGSGSDVNTNVPKAVLGLSTVDFIAAAGNHTCALETVGTVRCWGNNAVGQLGVGSFANVKTPQLVVGLTNVGRLALGANHSCALENTGTVLCWGSVRSGQIGVSAPANVNTPLVVGGLSNVSQLQAGFNHSCAVTTAGALRCWGLNASGQLGLGTNSNANTPQDVLGLGGVSVVGVGGQHTCAVMAGTDLQCWGSNSSGQLGLGTTLFRTTPQVVTSFAAPATLLKDYTDLWWAGEAETGWGMSIVQRGNTQFNVLYVYDALGNPEWVVMPGGVWNQDFSIFSGRLYRTSSAWFGEYDNISAVDQLKDVGSAIIVYRADNAATLSYNIDGITASKNISRQSFGPVDNAGGLNVGDLWWGGSNQNGWGMNISQQYRTLFAVWYTYNKARMPVWFVMPGGMWTGNRYSGAMYSFKNSPWLGTTFNPALRTVRSQGMLEFNFSDSNIATMTYNIEGTSQTKAIIRQLGNK